MAFIKGYRGGGPTTSYSGDPFLSPFVADQEKAAKQTNEAVKQIMKVQPSNVKKQNVFASQPKSEGFFKKADPTPMNQLVKPSYLVGSPTVEKGLSQYDALTNLTKMREMSLSGQLKGLAPVYGNDGRITGWQKSDAYKYIVPGYDLDGVAFSEKQSAMRTGIDPKAYQAMGLGERASHLGTEVKSMGSELGTGFSRVVDDAKGIISNLPFAKLFAGFGSNTTGTNDQQNNQQNNQQKVSSSNTGVMANVQSFDPPTSSTSGQLAGMSPEMLQYYLGLSDVDKQAFLGLDNAGRMAMMKPSESQEDQNFNFLGQYGAPSEVEDHGTEERSPFRTLNDMKDYLIANNLPLPPWAKY